MGMVFGIMRFLGERKFVRFVEIEAQSFPVFCARTSPGYFAIVVMMGCRTLQRLSVYHERYFVKASACLAALGLKELQGEGHCQNCKSAYKSPFHEDSNWRRRCSGIRCHQMGLHSVSWFEAILRVV